MYGQRQVHVRKTTRGFAQACSLTYGCLLRCMPRALPDKQTWQRGVDQLALAGLSAGSARSERESQRTVAETGDVEKTRSHCSRGRWGMGLVSAQRMTAASEEGRVSRGQGSTDRLPATLARPPTGIAEAGYTGPSPMQVVYTPCIGEAHPCDATCSVITACNKATIHSITIC